MSNEIYKWSTEAGVLVVIVVLLGLALRELVTRQIRTLEGHISEARKELSVFKKDLAESQAELLTLRANNALLTRQRDDYRQRVEILNGVLLNDRNINGRR